MELHTNLRAFCTPSLDHPWFARFCKPVVMISDHDPRSHPTTQRLRIEGLVLHAMLGCPRRIYTRLSSVNHGALEALNIHEHSSSSKHLVSFPCISDSCATTSEAQFRTAAVAISLRGGRQTNYDKQLADVDHVRLHAPRGMAVAKPCESSKASYPACAGAWRGATSSRSEI